MIYFLLDIRKKEVSLSGIEQLTDNAAKSLILVYLPNSNDSSARYNSVYFFNKSRQRQQVLSLLKTEL
jgi:hypothetical protein